VLDWGPQVLRDVAMATNFGSKIAITRFGYGRDLSGRPTKCRYCRYPETKGRCHGSICLSIDGMYSGATWRIRLNRSCAVGGDAVLCQITMTTCYYYYHRATTTTTTTTTTASKSK